MNKPYSKLKLIIADDHELIRDGLQVMIKKIEELEIVGEAVNGDELVKLTRKLSPDVILTDVKMPKMDGIEATKIIKKEFPHIGIIALSTFDEEQLIIEMIQAGAKGYILKDSGKKELTAAVQSVFNDKPYYCNEINLKLSQLISRGGNLKKDEVKENFTQRELEVIGLICNGLSSKQVAATLGLKTRTVERYRESIMDKMEVKNSAGLVNFAIKFGLNNIYTERK